MPVNSPLFNEAARQIKDMATRNFQNCEYGKLVRYAQSAMRQAQPATQVVNVIHRLQTISRPENIVTSLLGAEFGGMIKTIQRYSRGSNSEQDAVKTLLNTLGEPGKLITALINPRRRDLMSRSLQDAVNLIRAFGGEVLPNRNWGSLEDLERGLAAARQKLLEYGHPIQEVEGPTRHTPTPEGQRTTIDTRMADGHYQRVNKNHPLLTGEMVPTPASTNVYEFGYDINTATLYVRFQTEHEADRRGGPGSLYGYFGVTPEEFLALYAVRNKGGGEGGDGTPGTWVWEHCRERGTVSGHKKDYRLVGIMSNYVPRKATVKRTKEVMGKRGKPLKRKGLEEWYEQRQVKTHENRFVRSVLPTQRVASVMRGGFNRG